MTARRLFGLLTLFVMLHLTLVGPDNACADHGHGARAGDMRTGHSGHAMAEAPTAGTVSHGVSHEPCETPSSAHCCEAVTSCALSFAVAAREGSPSTAPRQDRIPASAVAGVLSRPLGPEPPPPKA